MPTGTSSPLTGMLLPLPVLLLQLFPKSSQTPPIPWSTGLGFPAQLSAPETCQDPSWSQQGGEGLFLPVPPSRTSFLAPTIVLPGFSGHPRVTPKLRFGCTTHPSSWGQRPPPPSPEETGRALGSCTFSPLQFLLLPPGTERGLSRCK